MMSEMVGKVAVVTGGCAGIGYAIVQHFALKGANIIVGDISPNDEALAVIRKAGGRADYIACDVSQESSVRAFAAQASEMHGGKVNILVNNAGTNGMCNLVQNMPLSAWEETLRINLTGTMLVSRSFIPLMIAAGSGQIVNIASNVSRRGVPWRADYVCSKWAIIGFTQTLALELARHNIRVNAVNPGPVAGDRIERILEMHAEAEGRSVEEVRRGWVESSPMRRFIEPQEVAASVEFLCSKQSGALTGQALEVSGGSIMN
jgi:NAD(P)-dependent dehydrogenase (short-subunit alcohol dehydrogenase family)